MLWSVYWAANVTLSVPLFVKVSPIFKKSSWINEADTQPGTRPSTRLWSLPSPGLGGTWERCSWSYSPRRKEDWVHPRKPPLGPAAGSSVSPALDSGFPRGRSCPWTFGRLMGGVRIPPWLRAQSPGCTGTRPETEPARTEGRGGRSRSWFLVRNSHLGILWRDRRKRGVRLSEHSQWKWASGRRFYVSDFFFHTVRNKHRKQQMLNLIRRHAGDVRKRF